MIHGAIFLPVVERVRERGLPTAIPFVYGPPQVPMTVGGTRLFMALDDESGDQYAPTRSQRLNPKHVGIRSIGVRVWIYAHATNQGAHRGDHERIALTIASMVHAAIDVVVQAAKTRWTPGRMGFRDDQTTDGWAGRVYEMRFAVDTPIADLTFKGEAAAEFEFATGATTLDPDGPGAATTLPHATTRTG